MRKQNNINPEQRPRPGLKPDQGFYHPEQRPTIEVYRDILADLSNRTKRDKNGNLIVKLDNGSYVVIDQQGNSSPYKPPKLPVFPENIFKPQYPPRRPRPGPLPLYPGPRPRPGRPLPGPMPIYPGLSPENFPPSRRPRPNPWTRPEPYNPRNPWGDSVGRPLPLYPEPRKPKRPGYLPAYPERNNESKTILFGKSMSKRAIPTQRTDNTRNKYGI